jgi:ABC-type Zn uptake system ZnuABC Zn-binding protein ZnuA
VVSPDTYEADGVATKLKTVAGNAKWNVLNLGSKFGEDDLLEGQCHHDHAKGDNVEHEHGIDPHIWLSVKHAKVMVNAIRDEFAMSSFLRHS